MLIAFSGTAVITRGVIADKEQLDEKLGSNATKSESEIAKDDPKEYARHDHFSMILFLLLVSVPVINAF